jgi:hypothetical protein
MNLRKRANRVVAGALVAWSLLGAARAYGEGGYPADYKPSKPAEKGETNVLTRVLSVSTYMTDKLKAAGGESSPMCYRNCLTVSLNDVLKCVEAKNTYATSESCEKDASQQIAACDPKCQ